MMDDELKLLIIFFPKDWQKLAHETNMLKGLRKSKSEENLLRTYPENEVGN